MKLQKGALVSIEQSLSILLNYMQDFRMEIATTFTSEKSRKMWIVHTI